MVLFCCKIIWLFVLEHFWHLVKWRESLVLHHIRLYTLNLKWNKCHWLADWNELKPWLSQVNCNLSNCRKEAWKNSDLNRIWTCAFLIQVGCYYQLSYWSSHMLEAMHTELDKGGKFLKKLWCCFGGRV